MATLLSALFLIALASSTAFAQKPTVAILGLEVVDSSGIDATTTSVARDLTEGLRARAKAGTGPYQLAIGSDKELIDEKLIHNCDETIGCMADIGKNLGAKYLIYGRLEKKSEGYVVTINLLNVDKRKMEKAKSPLTITQTEPAAIAAAAKKAYNDLTGTSEVGTLVITANAQRGTLLLNDEPKGNLNSGTATLTGLAEGRYRLAIEADGYQRSPEIVVTIRSGETAHQPVTLVEGKTDDLKHEITGTTSSSKSNIWKPIFGVTLAAAAGTGGFSFYSWLEWRKAENSVTLSSTQADIRSRDHCSGGKFTAPTSGDSLDDEQKKSLQRACKYNNYNIKAGIVAGAIGVLVVGTAYMAFFRGSAETQPTATAGRTKRKPFSVTPVVSPDGGGATFQIDW